VLGVFLGLILSIKYLGLISSGLIGSFVLVELFSRKGGPRWRSLGCILLGGLIIAGGWYFRNWWLTHNPFHPYFQSVFGGVGLGSEAMMHAHGLGKGIKELLLLPWNLTFHQESFGGWGNQIGPIFLGFLPFVFFIRKPSKGFWYLAVYLVLYGTTWFFLKQNTRFLFPALPFLSIVVALGAQTLMAKSRFLNVSCILSLIIFLSIATMAQSFPLRHYAKFLIGKETREQFLEKRLGIFPIAQFISEHLPQEATNQP